jgi:hypothetical protein
VGALFLSRRQTLVDQLNRAVPFFKSSAVGAEAGGREGERMNHVAGGSVGLDTLALLNPVRNVRC